MSPPTGRPAVRVTLYEARRTVRERERDPSMRAKLISLLTAALLTGGALAGASTASAATQSSDADEWDHVWITTDSSGGGMIEIKEHGDVVKICDTASDGYTPHATLSVLSTDGVYHLEYEISADGGYGACTTHQASDGATYDLPEGMDISVALYLGDHRSESDHYFLNDH
jgi:hypothetical protein